MTTPKTLMMWLMLQRTAAAAVAAVTARAPSPQANERRMEKKKEKTATYTVGSKERNKNTYLLFKFTARRRCTARAIYYYSFCIVYKYVVLSAGTKEVPRALRLISHIPRRAQES